MTLDQDLSLPQRHQAAVLRLLLVAHVAINLSFKIKPEIRTLVKFVFTLYYENYMQLYLKAPFFGRNSFT